MAAGLSHLLSVDEIKHKYEKTVIGCVSENEMFHCQGELCEWERAG